MPHETKETLPNEPVAGPVQDVVHTPGPWHVEMRNEPIGQTGDFDCVALIKPHCRERAFPSWVAEVSESDNQEANAKLIAAAPELASACVLLMKQLGSGDVQMFAECAELPDPIEKMESALKKAGVEVRYS